MHKKIIIFTIVLFIASSFWLFYQSDKQRNINSGEDWWAVYFADPKDDSLDFSIENHSRKNDFRWEIVLDGKKIQEGEIDVPKGETINSNFQDMNLDNFRGKRISVKITADGEIKEIYKNF